MINRRLAALHSFAIRRAISTGCAVLAALLVCRYFGFTKTLWSSLSALLVCQTTRGTPLRQGLLTSLFVLASLSACFFMQAFLAPMPYRLLLIAVIGVIMVEGRFQTIIPTRYCRGMVIVLLVGLCLPQTLGWQEYKWVMTDTLVGAWIGLICTALILPVQTVSEFIGGVTPILHRMQQYSERMGRYFNNDIDLAYLLDDVKVIRTSFVSPASGYPNWVYEVGFNRGLRAGFRSFLINLECLAELIFAMEYWLVKNSKMTIPHDLHTSIAQVATNNAAIINVLCERIHQQPVTWDIDLTDDIASLDGRSQRYLQGGVDLLSVSDAHLQLALFIRNLKDMRQRLLQMAVALT